MINNSYIPPPMTPRDYMVMIGETFYYNYGFDFIKFYNNIKDPSWPVCLSFNDTKSLPQVIQNEILNQHGLDLKVIGNNNVYHDILMHIDDHSNTIKKFHPTDPNGAMVSRIGKDLFFGTQSYSQDTTKLQKLVDQEFVNTRNHIVNTGGHSDATYCPVCPGLIISLHDIPTYENTYPDWEVVYLPGQSWHMVKEFLKLKKKNKGRWWIPGFENDQDVVDTVEQWLGHWTGYVEETVFDINMLIVDPKNVIVFNYNKLVFDALDRHGITPHVMPFRHRYFWDGGIHCITSDLHRIGVMQDFFPGRSK